LYVSYEKHIIKKKTLHYLANHLPCNYHLPDLPWHTIRTYRPSDSSSKIGVENTMKRCAGKIYVATHHNEKMRNAEATVLLKYIWTVWRSIHIWKNQQSHLRNEADSFTL